MKTQIDLFNQKIKLREMGVFPMIFVLIPLPYQNPKANIFTRKYNNMYLTFRTGGSRDVPSGKFPRSLLSLITTQFMRQYKDIKGNKEKRTIELGNISSVARKIGLTGVTGGKKGTGTFITNAMQDLAELNITTHCKIITEKFGGVRIENVNLIDEMQLLWNAKGKDEKELFDSYLIISDKFSEMLIGHCVPIDLYVYNELKSAQQQDLYAWAIRRLKTVNKEEIVPFDTLLPQFFDNVTRTSKPRQREDIKRNILEVTKYYPEAKIKATDTGLILSPSRLHIDEKNKGFV